MKIVITRSAQQFEVRVIDEQGPTTRKYTYGGPATSAPSGSVHDDRREEVMAHTSGS
jgi:hypothetical protein